MRTLALVLLVGCAASPEPDPVYKTGHADDPTFCVNVEGDGRKYTANNGFPNAAQAADGVQQGRYLYPAHCSFLP